ncbi:hypothetical protein LTR17_012271 [Elasticomyces elasticus]|nr:hypothetical protein LTR17_012271 [Elasticomyces elasticus]
MGLHHQETHGRVFRGIDARKHLEMHKRDSHGVKPKMHVPAHMKAQARPADRGQTKYFVNKAVATPVATQVEAATYTSVVYQTLSADFDGPIAGYVTLSVDPTTAASVAQSSSATPTNSHEAAYAAAKSAASAASTTVMVTSSVIPTSSAVASTSSVDDGSNNKSNFLNAPVAVATTASATLGAAAGVGTPLSATRADGLSGTPLSATHGAIAQDGHGMTTGAKAGLAIGVLLALALAGGLLFFCWRRRRNPAAHDEIHNEKRGSGRSSFFGGKAMSEKRASAVSVAQSIRSTASTAPRLSLRPVTQFLPSLSSDNRKNAGNSLDVSDKPKSMWERRSQTTQNPFDEANVIDEKDARPETPTNPFEEPEANTAQAESKVEAAATVAAPARGPNNVHRVQLDFKPSMEDELELKSGQLVRMLHAYDDGWALCIRMDRSQQGVVPRTCLSKLPVKPRPQGPPQGSNGRPISPMGPPAPGMTPRPLTPTGRERTGSSAGIERPSTPTGVPARKPVPGQAI